MAQNSSYPSPNSAQMSEGPFYASQNQLSAPDDVHTSAPLQGRPPPVNPNMNQFRHSHMPSPQQLAQSGLESAEGSSRKRTKVSRACDECRRKKIRCDAPSEDAGAQCSSCKRSDLMCQFSRQPQKRGPSKGYIKELASRVDALEGNRMQTPGYQYAAYEYSPQPDELGYVSKKRTHSMSEGLQHPAYMQEAQEPTGEGSLGRYPHASTVEWSGRDQLQHLLHAVPNDKNIDRTDPLPAFMSHDTNASHENFTTLPTDNHQTGYLGTEMAHSNMEITTMTDRVSEWKGNAINEYYRVIHTTLPLLPDSETTIFQYLDKTSIDVRKAFEKTLQVFLPASGSSPSNQQSDQFGMSATGLLAELVLTKKFESYLDGIVCLQAILLLLIVSTLRAHKYVKSPGFYTMAISMVNILGLGARKIIGPDNFIVNAEGDLCPSFADLDVNFCQEPARRAWLAFLVVERWYAIAGYIIPQGLARDNRIFTEDKALLKETGFHIVRLSLILGEITEAIREYALYGAPANIFIVVFRSLNSQLERFREQMEPMFESLPHVHLAFLHVKHVLGRHHIKHFKVYYTPEQRHEIEEPLGLALKIVDKLCSSHLPLSPWTHHFSTLCRFTLLERSQRTYVGDPVPKALQDLRSWYRAEENPLARAPGVTGEPLNIAGDESITNCLAVFAQKTRRGGLQHLADAAVGNTGTEEQAADDEAAKAS